VGEGGRSAAAERNLDLAGSVVKGRYRIDAVSSVSRDVVVYTAEDIRYGRPLALKVLRDEFAGDAEFVAAVREQAGTLARFSHAHWGVARVYECDVMDNGDLFVALERTKGAPLREVLDARGAFDLYTALRIASRVGESIEALHHSRIIHGQLGPDSVLIVPDAYGREHVTLVGVEMTAAYRTPIALRLREASSLSYRAPEQIERGETTEAADVYALGMLLRELLTAGGARDLPPAIERIITTALDARPEHRYADISVMVNDMWGAQAMLAESEPRGRSVKPRSPAEVRPRPRRSHKLRIAAAVVIGGGVAVAVWVASSDRIVSRFRARVTTPAATAVPVEQSTTPPPVHPLPTDPLHAPSSPSAAPVETSTRAESHAVKDVSPVEGLAPPVAKPQPAPVVVRQERVTAPVIGGRPRRPVESRAPAERPARMEQPVKDAGDGSAIIDWLLENRR
jgi:serine/threonine protein kinase